jgi:hypothetical protein
MSIDIGYKDQSGIWNKIGSVPIPIPVTQPSPSIPPTPPIPATNPASLYDDFQGGSYTLSPGQTSPNKKWQCIYGKCTANGSYMNLLPQAATQASETYSSLVATTTSYKDFDLSVDVQTLKQLRTGSQPNNWETAWMLWNRPTDDFHLYGFLLKAVGWQVEKKDNFTQDDAAEIYLRTGMSPSAKIGSWQHWRIKVIGTLSGTPAISVWIDGKQIVTFTDNNSQKNSPTMLLGGPILLYCEDSSTGFDNVSITSL